MATVGSIEYKVVTGTVAAIATFNAAVETEINNGYAPLDEPQTDGTNIWQTMFKGSAASFVSEYPIVSLGSILTAGSQTVTSDVPVAAGDTAILAASAGTYYFKVATDGGTIVEYSITTPAANQSYTAIAALLSAAWTLGSVVFDDAGDRFVFTSDTTGSSSSVSVTAGTTGVDVFAKIVTDGAPTAFVYNAAVAGTNDNDSVFEILGNFTQNFNAGYKFTVTRSTGNNGVYTVADGGSIFSTPNTIITVNEVVTSETVDGFIEAWSPSVGP
jgi:hypothetical protein